MMIGTTVDTQIAPTEERLRTAAEFYFYAYFLQYVGYNPKLKICKIASVRTGGLATRM
jgi:hypothetical protein